MEQLNLNQKTLKKPQDLREEVEVGVGAAHQSVVPGFDIDRANHLFASARS